MTLKEAARKVSVLHSTFEIARDKAMHDALNRTIANSRANSISVKSDAIADEIAANIEAARREWRTMTYSEKATWAIFGIEDFQWSLKVQDVMTAKHVVALNS